MGLLRVLGWLLTPVRLLIVAVLGIGMPLFIYLAFMAEEPVFGPDQDVTLGRQTVASLAGDPDRYPLLSRAEYPAVYERLQGIIDRVLQSPEIRYRDLFQYDEIAIIADDDTLNAFCTPGGFIYVYTGLIKYLDREDHLAGVLGHEIAHAELRHSSMRLQTEFGVQRLLEFVLLTTPVRARDVVNAAILKQLTTLRYSREQEAEADELSVRYLAGSDYACDGAAGFFEKLLVSGDDARVPELLSDHPDSRSRVRDIGRAAEALRCSTRLTDPDDWRAFQASLPGPAGDARAAGQSGDEEVRPASGPG